LFAHPGCICVYNLSDEEFVADRDDFADSLPFIFHFFCFIWIDAGVFTLTAVKLASFPELILIRFTSDNVLTFTDSFCITLKSEFNA
jgi:hypothetical protein